MQWSSQVPYTAIILLMSSLVWYLSPSSFNLVLQSRFIIWWCQSGVERCPFPFWECSTGTKPSLWRSDTIPSPNGASAIWGVCAYRGRDQWQCRNGGEPCLSVSRHNWIPDRGAWLFVIVVCVVNVAVFILSIRGVYTCILCCVCIILFVWVNPSIQSHKWS